LETLVVKFPLEARAAAIQGDPDVFSVTDHYRHHPLVLVSLLAVQADRLEELISGAWRMLASSRQIAEFEVSHRPEM